MFPVVFAKPTVREFTFSGSMGHFIGQRRTLGGIATMPPNSVS